MCTTGGQLAFYTDTFTKCKDKGQADVHVLYRGDIDTMVIVLVSRLIWGLGPTAIILSKSG